MNSFEEQLKNIGGTVDIRVKERVRENLMYQISNYERSRQADAVGSNFWLSFKSVKLAWKPVGIFTLVALFLFVSSGLAVLAAQNSMAGDRLFALKRMLEKSQVIVAADNVRQVELAGDFFANRVDELKKRIVEESQLAPSGKSESSEKVILAAAEVKKQLAEVNVKFKELRREDKQNNKETAVAALVLNEKIKTYKQELKEAKEKVKNSEVNSDLDEALQQVEEINDNVLEVIVDKHKQGELVLSQKDLEGKLEEHIGDIEVKVTQAEEILAAKVDANGKELKDKVSEAKDKIKEAHEAVKKNEYSLALTLSKDSSQIIKMLYGQIDQVVSHVGEAQTSADNVSSERQAGEGEHLDSDKALTNSDNLGSTDDSADSSASNSAGAKISEQQIGESEDPAKALINADNTDGDKQLKEPAGGFEVGIQ